MGTDHLSATFAAIADPTRRAILARLVSGEASVTELAKPFDMTLPAVSKHLKVLENAGLVSRGRACRKVHKSGSLCEPFSGSFRLLNRNSHGSREDPIRWFLLRYSRFGASPRFDYLEFDPAMVVNLTQR